MRQQFSELVSGSNVFIMPTAKCYDDLIKLLITSLIQLPCQNVRCEAERHRTELVTKHDFRLFSITKTRKYLSALCHVVASRQSIIVDCLKEVAR